MSRETTVTEFKYNKDGTIAKETRTVTVEDTPVVTLGSTKNKQWLIFVEDCFQRANTL